MFRQLLEGAGRSPISPEQDGMIDVSAQPVLKEALASFAIHAGVTVGKSLSAVAWASEGRDRPLVYDALGNEAAAAYQP